MKKVVLLVCVFFIIGGVTVGASWDTADIPVQPGASQFFVLSTSSGYVLYLSSTPAFVSNNGKYLTVGSIYNPSYLYAYDSGSDTWVYQSSGINSFLLGSNVIVDCNYDILHEDGTVFFSVIRPTPTPTPAASPPPVPLPAGMMAVTTLPFGILGVSSRILPTGLIILSILLIVFLIHFLILTYSR